MWVRFNHFYYSSSFASASIFFFCCVSVNTQVMEMKKESKQGSGRKKIRIERIRKGCLKKANELSVLCGAQIALIAFSPVGKPYVYGNPDLILNRFHNSNVEIQKDVDELSVCYEQQRFLEVKEDLVVEKKRGFVLEMMINSNWMRSDVEKLKICVEKRSDELISSIAFSSSSRFIDERDNWENTPKMDTPLEKYPAK
ncbi:hypothetical protein MKX01_027860 [Papaver californicum]|nr:hypothetical protein MKX01_027860 [Papaver californicum]